jgi:hypothetical protein
MGRTIQGERVDVLTVVTASHVLLAKTNGVLSGGNTVKDLEVSLRDAPAGEVDLHGKDTDILWTGQVVFIRGDDRHGGDSHLLGVKKEEDWCRGTSEGKGDYIVGV